MNMLRIIGDVHGQIDPDDICARGARPYAEIVAEADYSVQVGDMGDGQTYGQLISGIDPQRHRFLPGNHDHYNELPPHCLGDFGPVSLGGVDFFYIRGAASTDKAKLQRLGRELGRTLWYEQEELTDPQMRAAEQAYLLARPQIVITHDAPTEIARMTWQHALRLGPPDPEAIFRPSRTNGFLARLLEQHAPRAWFFGHHHRNFRCHVDTTQFVCIGELAHLDVDETGAIVG
jgi:predicted phosphodiesterase